MSEKKKPKSTRLTGMQLIFANEYIVLLNGTEAARNAGYSGDDNALAVQAHHNLRNPKILAYIEEKLEQYAMGANEVLVRLADIARGDISLALNSTGGIDLSEAKRNGKSHLVKRYKTKTTTMDDREIHEAEIEMQDQLKALELLAKFHDLVNRIKIDDWRSQALTQLANGEITPAALVATFGSVEAVREAFGDRARDLPADLFAQVASEVSVSEDS